MNNLSLSIVTLLHYNVIIRDTLEYCFKKDNYNLELFNVKKKGVMVEIEKPTPLKQFVDNNKEFGAKVVDQIKNLYATVYADDSTICRIANNELRVDSSQHLSIYDVVLELHDNIKNIISSHLGFAKSKGLLEDQLLKLVVADERMYRALCFVCLYNDLEALFVEYNKARNEAKGEITPQSNFIQGELQRVAKHINFVKDHQSCTENDYWDVVDYMFKVLAWTEGKRQLPEGKNFGDCFNEGRKLVNDFMRKAELAWKPLYDAAINELVTVSRKNNGEINVNLSNANNSNKPESTEIKKSEEIK